nr:extensin-like [Setaria viridis]
MRGDDQEEEVVESSSGTSFDVADQYEFKSRPSAKVGSSSVAKKRSARNELEVMITPPPKKKQTTLAKRVVKKSVTADDVPPKVLELATETEKAAALAVEDKLSITEEFHSSTPNLPQTRAAPYLLGLGRFHPCTPHPGSRPSTPVHRHPLSPIPSPISSHRSPPALTPRQPPPALAPYQPPPALAPRRHRFARPPPRRRLSATHSTAGRGAGPSATRRPLRRPNYN